MLIFCFFCAFFFTDPDPHVQYIVELSMRLAGDLGWSIHWINGTPYFQQWLWLTQTICSMFILVGYRTRMSCFIVWVIMGSAYDRNRWICDYGGIISTHPQPSSHNITNNQLLF